MVAIMDMTTGVMATAFHDDVERYGEEVLNANWLPQGMLEPRLVTVAESESARRMASGMDDPDEFLHRLYLAQE